MADHYFVAKTKEGGFIAQLTLEDIARKLRAGELSGEFVAAQSTGGSYHEAMKLGTASWMTVADLVANPLGQPTSIDQTDRNQLLTKQVITIMRRYNDAYVLANVTNGSGRIIKVIALAITVLFVLIGFIFISNGRAGDAMFALGVMTIVVGFIAGGLFYIVGVLVSAQGQILKASLDGAVNSSPFLRNEHRAKIMSLPQSQET